MKKFIIILIIIIVAVYYGFGYLNNNGILGPLNEKIDNFINDRPKIACAEDSDCHLVRPDCSICSCDLVAANIAWRPYCPFKDLRRDCQRCLSQPSIKIVKCVDTQCRIVY